MFSRKANAFVTTYSLTAAALLIVYLATTAAARVARPGESLSPAMALSCTTCFLALGPGVVLVGQRRIDRLALDLNVLGTDQGRRSIAHPVFVALLTSVTTYFAWLPTEQLGAFGVFPMDGLWRRVVYWVASSAVILLCAHGIYVAYRFLHVAWSFGLDSKDVLRALTRPHCEESFGRAHVYVSWAFSGVGALQLPILLLFRPALPRVTQAVALIFILILAFVGTFLFWLPRHWQRRRLQDEAAAIVRGVADGGPASELERLPAYDFWMQRLKTTGLSLTAPALGVAALSRYEDFKPLLEAARRLL